MQPEFQEKPVIKIYVSPMHNREKALRELQYGIEEESIPFELVESSVQGAVTMAWEASRSSRLEVGLGLDHEQLVLNYAKLEQNHPLFVISARSPEQDIRAIGANAARLVKKLPLKVISTEG